MLSLFLLFVWAGTVMSQSPCASLPTTSTFNQVVMRYTPFMSLQVAPTSTIYEQIVTTWFNAVDCRYVTPLRVDENPAAEGPFTTFVRSPVLTITRVGCMPETTAVTRRDVRGQNQHELATTAAVAQHKVHKRGTAQDTIDSVAQDMPNTLPSDLSSLTVQAYLYLVSVNTAVFAINLIQAGVDLNQTCALLREPASQAKLFKTTIDPVQAGDIVCFAANSGVYFEEPIPAVITYLEDVIYAIQARSTYPADSTAFCWSLEPINSPWLGFDLPAIARYLCPNAPSITSTAAGTSIPAGSITVGPSTGSASSAPTGGPFANTTSSESSITAGYGDNSTAVSATETAAPYTNSTTDASAAEPTSDASTVGATTTEVGTVGTIGTIGITSSYGTGITFPNATYTNFGTGTTFETGNLPPSPTAVLPEIESVTPSPARRFHRW